jgi:cohesin complex subunit SA-1/2
LVINYFKIALIREENADLAAVVDEFIKKYEENIKEAISSIITLIINSCGSLAEFKSEDIKNVDKIDLSLYIESFVKEFPKEFKDYPIVSKHHQLKIYTRNYIEFWNLLLKGMSDSTLFDDVFLDNIIGWLTLFSNSNVRPFRHTSTFTLYSIIDIFIELQSEFEKKMKKIEVQIKAAKTNKNKTLEKELSTTNKQMNVKIEKIQNTITEIFENVFKRRYRDTLNNIRALSLESLGTWVLNNPDTFLNNEYLKYFGWTLYDKDSSIRESILSTLNKLYSKENFWGQLQKFTKKFLPRYFEMCLGN